MGDQFTKQEALRQAASRASEASRGAQGTAGSPSVGCVPSERSESRGSGHSRKQDFLRTWWRAVRPFAYPASVVPALLGTAVAWSKGFPIHAGAAIAAVFGAVAAHTGANLMNDYWDFRRGVDRPGTLGGSGVLVEGIMPPRAVLAGSLVAFAIAAAIALPLCIRVGMPLVWLIIAGFIVGAGYVLPPFSFKYRALGDVAVFSAFGVGITLGSYVAQTLVFSWTPVFYAIPFGMLVAAILHANNIRDMGDDRVSSFKTFAGILGPRAARAFYAVFVFGAYGVLAVLILTHAVSVGSAAAFLTIPIAWRIVRRVLSSTGGGTLVGADAATAQLNLMFGLAMIVGIVAVKISGAS